MSSSSATDAPHRLLEAVLRPVTRAAEAQLKLSQELVAGWTRYWPGSSRRSPPGPVDQPARPGFPWTASVMDMARAQRALWDRQFDAAIASLDLAMGVSQLDREPRSKPVPARPPSPAKETRPVETPTLSRSVEGLTEDRPVPSTETFKNIREKVAIVTGAASGIGEAVSRELSRRGARAVLLVDRSDRVRELATEINEAEGHCVAEACVGDTTEESFRASVFDDAQSKHGLVTICVPAAGITRDALAVRVDAETGKADIYPAETFREVAEVNLVAPIYWALEMVARIAEDRRSRGLKRWEPEETVQGVVVFLGSVSSQGNKGQIAYAVAKAGLEGAAATLSKEAIFHGVRSAIIHPGFTDTPMARALGEDFLKKYVLPYTQLRRLIRPEEIADAICFMISNSAVSGELWADAGWHPPA